MERKSEEGMMEQSSDQFRHGSVETRREGLVPASQRFPQDPSGSINNNVRAPVFGIASGVKPIQNYASQTGEEFSYEFMRERAHSRKPIIPNSAGDRNSTTGYMDLKGILGITHMGSESGSDVSMLSIVEKGRNIEFEKDSSGIDNKAHHESVRCVPHSASGDGSSRGVTQGYISAGAASNSSTKMKFLCSFGGKILPRPSDGKLRYVGGDTRIIRISKDFTWQELMQKILTIYSQAHTIKYQLPGEELDALVSVSCDEDLQNMMEECNVQEGGEGSQKLRMFLFSPGDVDDAHFGLGSIEGDSEIQYVVAVNGMDGGSRSNSGGHGLAGSSANNLNPLLTFNIEDNRVTSRVEMESVGTSTAPLTDISMLPSTTLSSLGMQASLNEYETQAPSYQDQIIHNVGGEHLPFSAVHPLDSFLDANNQASIPLSVPSQYGYNSSYGQFGGSSVPMALHEQLLSLQQGGPSEGLYSGFRAQDSEVPSGSKLKVDGSNQQKSDLEQIQSLENEFFSSMQQQYDVSVSKEVSIDPSASESKTHLLSSKYHGKHQDPAQVSTPHDSVTADQNLELNEDDHYYISGGTFAPGFANSEADSTDFSYFEPALLSQRVFHSERIPREPSELRNRLSKSDDSIGSQYLIHHSRSSLAQQEPITESVESNPVSQVEQSILSEKPLYVNPPTIEEGLIQFEKYKDLADAMTQRNQVYGMESASFAHHAEVIGGNESMLKQNVCGPEEVVMARTAHDQLEFSNDDDSFRLGKKVQNAELNLTMLTPVDGKDTVKERKARHEANMTKQSKPGEIYSKGGDEADGTELERPYASPETSVKQQEDPSSKLPEIHWGEMPTKATESNKDMGLTPPFAWADNSTGAVSQEQSSVHAPAPEKRDLIDINERFPSDRLSDMFSKTRIIEDSSGISPLRSDEAGLSLNMQNHEPQSWSFFRNLAQDEFVRKDVSLMDQDHIAFPPPLTKAEEDPRTYYFPPSKIEGVAIGHIGSQIDFEEEIQQESSGVIGADTVGLHPDYIPSHVVEKGSESVQVEDISFSKVGENLRTPASEYEDGKLEVRQISGPFIDLSVDMSDLQIIKNEDLEELKELGSGTFGTVYHGKWRGTDVAIKRIKKSCFTGRSSEQERLTQDFWREAEIISKLHHPNVVAFYGVVQDGPGATLATVTEFMVNGSLRHVLLRKDRYLDRRKRLIIAMDAAFGMEYLHSKNIVHFDLKCDNLLVNLKDPLRPICKVGDFGLSKIKRNTLVSGGVRGTLPWMAPELLNGSSSKVSEKVDVFSFGIVMWEILTGEEPYANMHYGAIIGGIVNNTLRPPIPSYCDPEWRRLMEQCWAPDPIARPQFTEVASRLRVMSVAVHSKGQPYPAQNQVSK
eukprot:TRINITY_DN25666_c0_g1_i1.p1 TRINITY_DN25666_c0_g1~~TRINITY_DN25666_c0_g1_i1.p1  ORF type:complete len:1369 (+),score=298.78 TRINITY_DN25666_c0_g1_i1:457-4563(+)